MTILELHTLYFRGRVPTLNEDEFETLVSIYPALLVAMADDEIQKEERDLINNAATEIVEDIASVGYSAEQKALLQKNYLDELNLLTEKRVFWEENFLYTLSLYLEIKPEFGAVISDFMSEIAATSDGINEKELAEIFRVKSILGID